MGFERHREVVQIAGIGERVEHDQAVIGIMLEQITGEVGTDEAGAAGDQNGFHATMPRGLLNLE